MKKNTEQHTPFNEKSVTAGLPRPWNRVNLPVYSISSEAGGRANMHIITYATAISMQPKKMLCAVYQGTQTLDNIRKKGSFILQLLGADQYHLVRLLGKESGRHTDKISRLEKRKEPLAEWRGFRVLGNCLSLCHLRIEQEFPGGDHVCFVCGVDAWRNLRPGTPLTLDDLRNRHIIRI